MPESVYRRNPIKPFVSVLQERSGLLSAKQGISGKSIQVRNPAYIYITGVSNKCGGGGSMTLPQDKNTWDSTYNTYKPSIKPYPTLKNVSLEFGGDWGLAQKISARIECYTLADFKRVRDAFLLPGNYISCRFGYSAGSAKWHSKSQSETTLSNFRVATFSFTAGGEGSWVCSFTAVSSATAIKNTDMMSAIGIDGLTYIIAGELEGSKIGKVKAISELIACDAQRNGKYSIDQLKDGHVLSGAGDFGSYDPGNVKNRNAAIAVYEGDHLRGWWGRGAAKIKRWAATLFHVGDEATQTNNQVYVTLGYIVNRIINDAIMKTIQAGVGGKDQDDFKKLKIQFDPKYSKTVIPSFLRSGDPTSVLLIGGGKGKYKSGGYGKDFESIKAGPKDQITALNGTEVSLEKILIHRDVVLTCLGGAVKVRPAESDNADVKDTQEQVISILDFFNNISDAISESVGGAISVRLVEDVSDPNRNDFIVVDQNNGGNTPIQCPVLNPIDADGSTRSCQLQSNVGSQEFKAAMFIGNSKKGDPAAALRNCYDQVESARSIKYVESVAKVFEIIEDPGLLCRDYFEDKQIDALKAVMVDVYRNRPMAKKEETIHWPGLSISATLDGAWGIIPGCAISSTQVPDDWRNLNVYFMVTRVTHNFADSDWTTDIDGIMSYYDNLNYVGL